MLDVRGLLRFDDSSKWHRHHEMPPFDVFGSENIGLFAKVEFNVHTLFMYAILWCITIVYSTCVFCMC